MSISRQRDEEQIAAEFKKAAINVEEMIVGSARALLHFATAEAIKSGIENVLRVETQALKEKGRLTAGHASAPRKRS